MFVIKCFGFFSSYFISLSYLTSILFQRESLLATANTILIIEMRKKKWVGARDIQNENDGRRKKKQRQIPNDIWWMNNGLFFFFLSSSRHFECSHIFRCAHDKILFSIAMAAKSLSFCLSMSLSLFGGYVYLLSLDGWCVWLPWPCDSYIHTTFF